MNYYQFHIADWALHTAHLTLEEEGVYRRLLDHYYDTESPIPEETQPVIRRLRLRGYEETVALILEEFFMLKDGGWGNRRDDTEIAAYQAKAEQARANGKKGGRPKKNKELGQAKPRKTQPVISGNPEESESKANQEPRTKNHKPIKATPKNKFSDDDMVTAEYFYSSILKVQPDYKKPNLNRWANTVRLMRERDNRTLSDICAVWAFARQDVFWQQNILSAEKLREKYDQLKAKMRAPHATHQPNRKESLAERSWRESEEILADIEAREAGERSVAEDAPVVWPQVGQPGGSG